MTRSRQARAKAGASAGRRPTTHSRQGLADPARDVGCRRHRPRRSRARPTSRWPLQDAVTRWCFGETWSRDELDPRTRSMLTLGVLMAIGQFDQVKVHTRGAIANGVNARRRSATSLLAHDDLRRRATGGRCVPASHARPWSRWDTRCERRRRGPPDRQGCVRRSREHGVADGGQPRHRRLSG